MFLERFLNAERLKVVFIKYQVFQISSILGLDLPDPTGVYVYVSSSTSLPLLIRQLRYSCIAVPANRLL